MIYNCTECDDFLNCGYKEQQLVIFCNTNFWLFFSLFLFHFKLCSHTPSEVNMLKPMKHHQWKLCLNCAYVWPSVKTWMQLYKLNHIMKTPALISVNVGWGTVCKCCKQHLKMKFYSLEAPGHCWYLWRSILMLHLQRYEKHCFSLLQACFSHLCWAYIPCWICFSSHNA